MSFIGILTNDYSLITPDVVLTAAHCMDFGDERNFLERIVVKLGDHDITQVLSKIIAGRLRELCRPFCDIHTT